MKTEDFERLKAVCEKEGFVISTGGVIPGSSILVEVYKKDPWDGVEFAECVKSSVTRFTEGKIYKVNPKGNGVDLCDFLIDNNYHPNGFVGSNREYFKPSTEDAYIKQLKKEAHERFGEIKDGDEFKFNNIKQKCLIGFKDFVYYKHIDRVIAFGAIIYEKGKWAERVKERVEVQYKSISADKHNLKVEFELKDAVRYTDIYKGGNMARFLAEQMEKYLNNEL